MDADLADLDAEERRLQVELQDSVLVHQKLPKNLAAISSYTSDKELEASLATGSPDKA